MPGAARPPSGTARLLAAAIWVALLPTATAAQTIAGCDAAAATARQTDWTDAPRAKTRTYANGAIRLVVLEVDGLSAPSVNLMVLFPAPPSTGPACKVISPAAGLDGFRALSLDRARSSYDAAIGLSVAIPGTVEMSGSTAPVILDLTINQALGSLVVGIRRS